jgi:dynactin 4
MPTTRNRSSRDRSVNKDEMPEYKSRVDITSASAHGSGGGDMDVEFISRIENIGEVARLDQRWTNSWSLPIQTK